MKKGDNIEELFKKKFENFEADVNPTIWKNIQTSFKGLGLGLLVKYLLNKIGVNTIIVILSSVATIISMVMVMNWTKGTKNIKPIKCNTRTTITTVQKTTSLVNESVIAIPKEEQKPITTTAIENKKTTVESTIKNENIAIKKDTKKIESVISKFSHKPIADIFASPISGEVPLIVSLMNNGTGKTNKWTFGDTKSVETETSPVHIYNEPGEYKVKLTSTDDEGKTTVDSVFVEVIGNPSMSMTLTDFSLKSLPIKLSDTKNIIKMHAIIFNKEGKLIYESNEIDSQWDGKNLKGQQVKEGIYFYIINAEGAGGKKYERQGSINLTK